MSGYNTSTCEESDIDDIGFLFMRKINHVIELKQLLPILIANSSVSGGLSRR